MAENVGSNEQVVQVTPVLTKPELGPTTHNPFAERVWYEPPKDKQISSEELYLGNIYNTWYSKKFHEYETSSINSDDGEKLEMLKEVNGEARELLDKLKALPPEVYSLLIRDISKDPAEISAEEKDSIIECISGWEENWWIYRNTDKNNPDKTMITIRGSAIPQPQNDWPQKYRTSIPGYLLKSASNHPEWHMTKEVSENVYGNKKGMPVLTTTVNKSELRVIDIDVNLNVERSGRTFAPPVKASEPDIISPIYERQFFQHKEGEQVSEQKQYVADVYDGWYRKKLEGYELDSKYKSHEEKEKAMDKINGDAERILNNLNSIPSEVLTLLVRDVSKAPLKLSKKEQETIITCLRSYGIYWTAIQEPYKQDGEEKTKIKVIGKRIMDPGTHYPPSYSTLLPSYIALSAQSHPEWSREKDTSRDRMTGNIVELPIYTAVVDKK